MVDRKNQKRMLGKFVQVFLTTFALLMIVIAIGTVVYVVVAQKKINTPLGTPNFSDTVYGDDTVVDGEIVESALNDKKITTFAVFGVDKDNYRTDVNMLVFFNHETAEVDIISIPRDTRVKIPDELYAEIAARRSDVSQIVKINEVPAYIIDDRNEASVAVLEKSLGVDIDYYVKMDLDVFKKIVDTIGEITVTIPFDMEYSDPNQDLYISLKAGEQQINGAQAEQLVRFRSGYGNGDIGRIEMQHNFMKAFVKQLLTTKNRLNMLNIVGDVLLRVETNFEEAVDYLVFLDDIDPEKFEMHMLPGNADDSSRSYYIYDYDATKLLMNDIVNDPYLLAENEGEVLAEDLEPVLDIQPEVIVDVDSMTMQVLNGTNISKIAGIATTMLEDEGYTLLLADNYEGDSVDRTMIMVPYEEAYEALKGYFLNPEMVLKESMVDEEAQIVIVLGTDDGEKLRP